MSGSEPGPSTSLREIPEERVAELVQRLDVRGPRYTSYPTAPVWSGSISARDHARELAALAERAEPVAAYLHLPYCRKRCLYCGCNSVVTNERPRIAGHIEAILAELDSAAELFEGRLRHAWLHLGGGTPTHTSPEDLARLLDRLLEVLPGRDGAERSIEVDPRVTTDEHLRLLAARDFRRISIGLQDLEPAVQEAVQREFSFEQTAAFIERCREAGFTGVNVDLIYGLPRQTRESWRRTLERVGGLRPDRLACFGYAHLPKKLAHQRAIRQEQLPGPRERLGMLLDAFNHFTGAGYTSIGMDHFAVSEDKLARAREAGTLWRNFMGYTDIRGLEMVGFGASAISELEGLFSQNQPRPESYEEAVREQGWATFRGHRLDEDDRVRKTLINDLMCNLRVRIPEEAEGALRSELRRASASLAPWAEEGLIVPVDDGWQVTPLGQLFVRNLAMAFDRYLPEQEGVTFSRTV